ncbi:hypothetical protein [Paraburkholderia sp. BL6665CI2N2]|uniref:hypothetical protein n=1 Tax=Paraburkholderia sp. BL6665CI2N2 TaxID=1938806 RepID=UPI001416F17B|nr:hypothetical protein [Paraburkholderia sp. BL6665CI2N2]
MRIVSATSISRWVSDALDRLRNALCLRDQLRFSIGPKDHRRRVVEVDHFAQQMVEFFYQTSAPLMKRDIPYLKRHVSADAIQSGAVTYNAADEPIFYSIEARPTDFLFLEWRCHSQSKRQ